MLKDLGDGKGLSPEEVPEMRRTSDFSLRATKQTATVIGCVMAGLLERFLEIKREWTNEIPTVPTCYLVKPRPRKQTWQNQREKKILLSLTVVWHCEET
ncbi:unnamed protein product [Leuciscus chuanchicus]